MELFLKDYNEKLYNYYGNIDKDKKSTSIKRNY